MGRRKLLTVINAIIFVAFITTFNYGCGGGGGGGGSSGSSASAIAAPSNLQVTKSYGSVYLTWTDNSNNEQYFIVYTRQEGGAWSDMGGAGWVSAGTTSWNDSNTPLSAFYPTATKLYFEVTARTSTMVESNPSNVVSVTMP